MRGLSLCSGYGGLDMAVESLLPVEWVAFAENDPSAASVFESHWSGLPNLGDITTFDWTQLGPIDLMTAGYPCQPFSHAGKRKGVEDERHLWPHIADAVRVLRPRVCFFENVRGHLGLGFDTVLADLAALGFDVEWALLRAADVGAPHSRSRLWILAQDADRAAGDQRRFTAPGQAQGRGAWADAGGRSGVAAEGLALLPTPAVNDMGRGKTPEQWDAWTAEMQERHGNGNGGPSLEIEAMRLLPTPVAEPDTGNGHARNLGKEVLLPTPDTINRKSRRAMTPSVDNGRRTGGGQSSPPGLEQVAELVSGITPRELLPTPSASDGLGGHERRGGDRSDELLLAGVAKATATDTGTQWGKYEPAIRRWEAIFGRPAPAPLNAKGRLSPRLPEWMMGLPDGWVCDRFDIDTPKGRNAALKILGNGVCPQQAYAAFSHLLSRMDAREVAA